MAKIIYTHTDEAPAAGDVLVPAGHPGVRLDGRVSTWRPATSRWPGASSPVPRAPRPRTSASTTPSPSSASWPRRPRPTSSSCRTSRPRSRSSRPPIAELQEQGYALPDYPDDPKTDEERDDPRPLRQGQGQRRQPGPARGQLRPPRARRRSRTTPRPTRTRWAPGPPTRRPTSRTWAPTTSAPPRSPRSIAEDGSLRIELVGDDGTTTVLRESVPVLAGEVVDATVMRVAALREFLTAQIARAKAEGVLFSVHLKATMMKVSDPIIFGHVVRAFFPKTFAAVRRGAGRGRPDARTTASAASSSGLDVAARGRRDQGRPSRPSSPRARRSRWSTPTSGITNLHVPSDVIVDASMPAMIRTSGHMWGPDGEEADTLAVIPDSSYAGDLPGRHRRLPRATAPSTRRPWARCPTSA